MKKIKLHHQIFIGLILGVVIGLVFGENASVIKPIGTIFINLIIMIAALAGLRHSEILHVQRRDVDLSGVLHVTAKWSCPVSVDC